MDAHEILSLYDREMRAGHPSALGLETARVGPLVRAVGSWNMVLWAELDAANADAAIASEQAFFTARGEPVEWMAHGHDTPPDLAARLAAAGFVKRDEPTLLAYDLADGLPEMPQTAAEVRRVEDVAGLRDLVAAGGDAFGEAEDWRVEALTPHLPDPQIGLYVAYVDGAPAASARVEMLSASFAGLWGGGVAEAHRGLGIYRALVAARAVEAAAKGHRFLYCEARETSRPILQRMGFVALTTVGKWGWRPYS